MTDPYKILDLEPDATWKEVRSAYKELAQIYHPDKHTKHSSSVQKRALEKFNKINQAYEVLERRYKKEHLFKPEKKTAGNTARKQEAKENKTNKKAPRQTRDEIEFEKTLKRAERGFANSQFNLGTLYEQGKGVPNNNTEALKWYRLAAEQGNAPAQYNLGVMYDQGKGVPNDDEEALKWYRLAAEQGVEQAQFNLGLRYETGDGVPKNDKEALRWCRLAAEQGNASAQYNLGLRYGTGEGVPKNYVLAHMWFSISGSQGMKAASKNREVSEKRMSPEQIERAQEMAKNWIQKKSKNI